MARVLLLPPPLSPRGGGVGVAVWMLQSLSVEHDVSVLDDEAPNWSALDRFYGTSLAAHPPGIRRCPPAPPVPHRLVPGNLMRRLHRARQGRRIAGEFDLCISLGECDFAVGGLQYISYPWLIKPRGILAILRWWWPIFFSGFSLAGMRRNLSLTNSRWTAEVIREVHGVQARVLYPPVVGPFTETPWELRSDDFVTVGRGIPCKRLPFLGEILHRLRGNGWMGRFHIVSSAEDWAAPEWKRIQAMAGRFEWIQLYTGVSREELGLLLGRCRYGIHGMSNEHFGMAPAEMVRAGCLVFVPDDGGQVEIVGSDSRLTYLGTKDAVDKISAVLDSAELQKDLLGFLRGRADMMSEQHFMTRFREIVEGLLV